MAATNKPTFIKEFKPRTGIKAAGKPSGGEPGGGNSGAKSAAKGADGKPKHAQANPKRTSNAPGHPARELATGAIAAVLEERMLLEVWFETQAAAPGARPMEPRDKALARSIALVSLRNLGAIRKILAQFLAKGMPRKSGTLEYHLITGAAQLLYMDVPDHAAVDIAVELCRENRNAASFAALANAVLRNIIRGRDALQAAIDPLRDNTPPWLANSWIAAYGETTARAIAAANSTEPTLDLTVKSAAADWAQNLGGIVLPTGSVRLLTHDAISDLAGYAEGAWWVQDSAASLPAKVLNAKAEETIADLCAAPGGKTAQLALAGAEVTAFDRSKERLIRLHANLARLNLSADIDAIDVFDLTPETYLFDAILLDAPCSATGTIRRHPDVAWLKQAEDVRLLALMQAKMLDKALSLLKPGGRLVYCVCSLQPEEGPAQITALLARNPKVKRVPISAEETGLAELITLEGDIRTLPSHLANENPRLSGLDGFYVARLALV